MTKAVNTKLKVRNLKRDSDMGNIRDILSEIISFFEVFSQEDMRLDFVLNGEKVLSIGTNGNDGKIGTFYPYPFYIFTNNTDRIVVDENGNVGIGTNDPSDKLHVVGNIVQPSGYYIITDKVRAVNGDGLSLQDDGGNGVFVKDGGDVGIGTETPGYSLEVYRATSGAQIVAKRGDGAEMEFSAAGSYGIIGTRSTHNLRLRVNTSVTGIEIDTSGKIHVPDLGTPESSHPTNYAALYVDTDTNKIYSKV